MLKFTVTASEYGDLSADVQKHYKASGDDYVLETSGDHPDVVDANRKRDDFRSNNIKLQGENRTLKDRVKELETQAEQFKDVDIEKYTSMQAEIDALKKKTGAKGDDLAAVVDAALDARLKPTMKKVEKLTASLEAAENREKAANEQVQRERFNNLIADGAKQHGVRATAIDDIRSRASGAGWRIGDDGELRMYEGDEVATNDRGDPIALKDWLLDQKQNSGAHLFEATTGAGTPPGSGNRPPGGGSARVVENPTNDFLLQNAEKIASGEIVVSRT